MLSFSTLTTSDASIIHEFVRKFAPYSDFNFVSLYSWSLFSKTKYCLQGDCLFLIFPDYTTQELSFTFLCNKNTGKNLELYIDWLQKKSLPLRFSFLSEEVAQNAAKYLEEINRPYKLSEDRNSFDYILDTERLCNLRGKEYADFRYKVSTFEKLWGDRVSSFSFDSSNKLHLLLVTDLAKKWVVQKNSNNLYKEELYAIRRFLDLSKYNKNIRFKAYSYNSKLLAWAGYEIVSKHYAIGHFLKYDSSYRGIYNKLVHEVCADLATKRIKRINIEQDLGIESLRRAKMHLRPTCYLKKYNLTIKD